MPQAQRHGIYGVNGKLASRHRHAAGFEVGLEQQAVALVVFSDVVELALDVGIVSRRPDDTGAIVVLRDEDIVGLLGVVLDVRHVANVVKAVSDRPPLNHVEKRLGLLESARVDDLGVGSAAWD